MAEHSTIKWTDATWNPITGCSVVSPGCTNCYAMQLAGTRLKNHPSRFGLTKAVNGNHVWTGEVRLNEQWLGQPIAWKRPRRIFVCAHGDLFHESVPDEWIDRVFALCPQHKFQVLTKRSERLRKYLDPDRHYRDVDASMIIWRCVWQCVYWHPILRYCLNPGGCQCRRSKKSLPCQSKPQPAQQSPITR